MSDNVDVGADDLGARWCSPDHPVGDRPGKLTPVEHGDEHTQQMRMTKAIPALPVRSTQAAIDHWVGKLGFEVAHQDDGFAVLVRDEVEIHLWEAGDTGWIHRPEADLRETPVCTGAESFIAGTASCRLEVDDVEGLYVEMAAAGVLHPSDGGRPVVTDFGTTEFACLDLDGNLVSFYRQS